VIATGLTNDFKPTPRSAADNVSQGQTTINLNGWGDEEDDDLLEITRLFENRNKSSED